VPIAQAGVPVLNVAAFPFVEGFPGKPEPSAHAGDVALLGRLPQDPQPPGRYPNLLCFGHGISDSGDEPKQES